ncbi:MAG: hypothetical protein R3C26_08680 [Calditrichia bacterium]
MVDGSLSRHRDDHRRTGAHHDRKRDGVKIEGGEQAHEFAKTVESVGPKARNLAELGVGTNDSAQINGTILEDEKVLGTVHLALGNNMSMGGTCDVGFHVDGILLNPTLTIDDVVILKDGKMIIDLDT